MKRRIKKSLLIQFFFLFSALIAHASTLEEKWEEKKSQIESGQSLLIRNDIVNETQNFHFFFVPGVLNEWADIGTERYFTSFRRILDRFGATHTLYTSPSGNPISTNVRPIYDALTQASQRYKKPLVVIGHSKGGAELLSVLMEYPELIHNQIVDRFVSIQGVIGGSPLANSRSLSTILLRSQYGQGLDSLKPRVTLESLEMARTQLAKKLGMEENSPQFLRALLNFKKRIFYVRSCARPEELSYSIRGVRKAVKGFHGNRYDVYHNGSRITDGLVLIEDQIWVVNGSPFGVDLGILNADHTGLTVRTFGNIDSAGRSAFAVSLLETIFDPMFR